MARILTKYQSGGLIYTTIITRTRCHVSTKVEFDVGQFPLRVHVSEDAHVFDGECLVLDRCLEALLATPSHVPVDRRQQSHYA
jgi:hypothetical protein